MKKNCLCFAIITFAFIFVHTGIVHAQDFPIPAIKQDCKDEPWFADGYWGQLEDGQYGAESTKRKGGKHKWKICIRKGIKIHSIWCKKLPVQASTKLLNDEFSTNEAEFVEIKISDSGTHKATGFWVFKKR